jgi:hypothetical protein
MELLATMPLLIIDDLGMRKFRSPDIPLESGQN